ncbi:hypothetical protein G9C85_06475 [Halorubellus sp. JP-L1]|uniref:DUF7344 domain-containing protein n=1 Tax=Halorubellus sp. JP-L1 TaxID=2715753 RepID=UPI00140BBF23|nr:hypothetical protein [Halorubellus sp. JP-L1]NHN41282.1 hypothetical protein [Halorubellus sp. JP-L1]
MAFSNSKQGAISWETEVPREALAALANERRRTLLGVLERQSPASPTELATRVAATEDDTARSAVPAERRTAVERTLHHRHLPTLEDARLLHWTDGTVTLGRRAPLEVWEFVQTFETDAVDWDDLFSILESERCRTILSTLASAATPIDRTELAATVASGAPFDATTVDETEVELHHGLLPKLERIDLLAYDSDAGVVHPADGIETVDRVVSSVAN